MGVVRGPLSLVVPAGDASDTPDITAARIRAGDIAAFEAFFRATSPGLCVFLMRYAASRSAAEDIVQDVFAALWARRETLVVRESLTTYVYTAGRNRAWSLRSREQRRVTLAGSHGAPSDEHTESPDASALLEQQELAQALARAIAALPLRCRETFVMSRREGMTYPQIAAALGVSVKTVETQIGRAMKSLRRQLRPHLP